MRPPEVFVRELTPEEGNRLKSISRRGKYQVKRQRAGGNEGTRQRGLAQSLPRPRLWGGVGSARCRLQVSDTPISPKFLSLSRLRSAVIALVMPYCGRFCCGGCSHNFLFGW
jgi:hypothetical protein